MPKISDEKRAARRAQILNAAWTCFQKEGLHATTMDDIIKASGLSAGAVYSYFPGKSDLILAAVTTSLTDLTALVLPLFSVSPPLSETELLRQITANVARFSMREGFDLRRIALLGWSEAQRDDKLRATMNGFYQAFRARLVQAAEEWKKRTPDGASVSEEDVAKTLLALILGFVVQSAIMGDVEPENLESGLDGLARLRG
ncbi:TetR/AcrR family transcriptional regulator [Rhodoblastus sp.]|uniref:TetR/AcrR family transcriptional regulator n=1 Tax=Rhodoblastus sp. TaxID=1962975 RepID=UPI0035AE4D0D